MGSAYTANARFTLQATGENNNTWGVILNSGVFQLVDDNINGRLGLVMNGGHTLTTALGAPDEQRMAFIDVTGGTGGQLGIGNKPKGYFIRNGSAGLVFPTVAGVQGVSFNPGDAGPIFSDGATVYGLQIAGLSLKDYITSQVTGGGNLPTPIGSLNKALVVRDFGAGPVWTPDLLSNSSLAAGTAEANLGYHPANAAGQAFTGTVTAPTIMVGAGARFSLITDSATYSQLNWDSANVDYEAQHWGGAHEWVMGGVSLMSLTRNGDFAVHGTLFCAAIGNAGVVGTAALADGSVTPAKLAPGAAAANLGFAPANRAGDTFSGNVAAPGFYNNGRGMILQSDGVTFADCIFDNTLNYRFRQDWASGFLSWFANGAQVWSLSPNGDSVQTGTARCINAFTVNASSAVGATVNFSLDGATRWHWQIAPATGHLLLNAFGLANDYKATPIWFNLGDYSVNVGAASRTIFSKSGEGASWSGGGAALHLIGADPGIIFNYGAAGTAVAFGQISGGRTLVMNNAAGGGNGILFDINAATIYAGNFLPSSDRRLKFDLKPLKQGLAALAGLTPFTYRQAVSEDEARQKIGRPGAGVIAQELVGTPFERLVQAPDETQGRPYYSLDYNSLAAFYIAAFKEISERLEALEALVVP